MGGRAGISRLGPEARRERARAAAEARWGGDPRGRAGVLARKLVVQLRGLSGGESHVRNLERLLVWLEREE